MSFELALKDTWQGREEWFFNKKLTSTYEGWYEGRYKRAEIEQKKIISDLLKPDTRVNSILEIGCGTSRFTRWWKEIDIHATGLDISPLMLAQAVRLFDGNLVLGNSASVPFRGNSFDSVAFITTFEYYPDPVKVIREAARVAKYGIVFGMIHRNTTKTIRRRVQQLFGKNPYYITARFYTPSSLKKVIAEALEGRKYSIEWKCTGLPSWFPVSEWKIAYGDFMGMYVKLEE